MKTLRAYGETIFLIVLALLGGLCLFTDWLPDCTAFFLCCIAMGMGAVRNALLWRAERRGIYGLGAILYGLCAVLMGLAGLHRLL